MPHFGAPATAKRLRPDDEADNAAAKSAAAGNEASTAGGFATSVPRPLVKSMLGPVATSPPPLQAVSTAAASVASPRE